MNYLSQEAQINLLAEQNKKKTWKEVGANFLKGSAMGLAGISLLAVGAQLPELFQQASAGTLSTDDLMPLFINGYKEVSTLGPGAVEVIKHSFEQSGPAQFFVGAALGAAVGLKKNQKLVNVTLRDLNAADAIEPSNYKHFDIEDNPDGTQTYVFNIHCVDKRREDKSGGAFPGVFGPIGAPFRDAVTAAILNGLINPDAGIGVAAATGYTLFANALTINNSLRELKHEVDMCVLTANQNSTNLNPRIKILLHDHMKGCGAEGFTSLISYLLKFKAHLPLLADLYALPNEVLGYMAVNMILSPAYAKASKGKISLTAVLKRSDMIKN